ncbi:MAG: photosystem II reaction center PsbP [Prochloraceae cyanobacterium]
MYKSFIATILIIFTLVLYGCSSGVGGLQKYVNTARGYEFLYPNGWIGVDVQGASEGVDTVYRDLIEESENLSVIISRVPSEETLESLGDPTEVGYRFMKKVNNADGSDREAELIAAGKREDLNKDYYLLEYRVKLPGDVTRHNLASVVVNNGKLYTFNISTRENRYKKVKNTFKAVAESFTVY